MRETGIAPLTPKGGFITAIKPKAFWNFRKNHKKVNNRRTYRQNIFIPMLFQRLRTIIFPVVKNIVGEKMGSCFEYSN